MQRIVINTLQPANVTEGPEKALNDYLERCAQGEITEPVEVMWIIPRALGFPLVELPRDLSTEGFWNTYLTRADTVKAGGRQYESLTVGALCETACAAGNHEFVGFLSRHCSSTLSVYFNEQDYSHENVYQKLIKPAYNQNKVEMIRLVNSIVAHRFSSTFFRTPFLMVHNNPHWVADLFSRISITSLYECIKMFELHRRLFRHSDSLKRVRRREELARYISAFESDVKGEMVERALFDKKDCLYIVLRLFGSAAVESPVEWLMMDDYKKMLTSKPISYWYGILAEETLPERICTYAFDKQREILLHILSLKRKEQMAAIDKILNQPQSQLSKFYHTASDLLDVKKVLKSFQARLTQLQSMVDEDKCELTTTKNWAAMYPPKFTICEVPDNCETANEFLWSRWNSSKDFGKRR